MPSPLGHALGGLAAGWMFEGPGTRWGHRELTNAALFAAVAIAPDLDLLFGVHRGPTHSIGAAAIVALLGYVASRETRFAAALAAACASHMFLDWLGRDSTPPIGVMALWPFSREYYGSSVQVFEAISRRYWLPEFWLFNLRAVVRELLILLPVTTIVALLRKRS